MAKKLAISQPAYCKLEKSRCIKGDRLEKVIDALGLTQQEFEETVRLFEHQWVNSI